MLVDVGRVDAGGSVPGPGSGYACALPGTCSEENEGRKGRGGLLVGWLLGVYLGIGMGRVG